MRRARAFLRRLIAYYSKRSIQLMIAIPFTLVAVGGMVAIGALLYAQFTESLRHTIVQENQQLVNQIALNINNYNARMRDISTATYYNIIKKVDLAEQSLNREFSLMYESNTGTLVSVACYTQDGELVAAAPLATPKPHVDVTQQDWFIQANTVIENPHFSTPHVQNLFEDSSEHYYWVISLSQMVELTHDGTTSRGVLVVDMNYSGIEMIFQQTGSDAAGYAYLIDRSGDIIYHPKQKLIYSGLYEENNLAAARYADGIYEETFAGVSRQVIVKTVSYTGWRIVSVVPNSEFAVSFSQMRLFVIAVVGLAVFLIIVLNAFVSSRVAGPIKKLDRSIKELENGKLDLDIYIGGPEEVEHLGRTIRSTVEQLRQLMQDVVVEQEQKRRSEFDALQAQINPHFLYNTLDSIVWMVESERYREAISMVTALASLFRISLSRGSTVIPIRTELEHAQHYLHIQNIRYRNKFLVEKQIDPAILEFYTIKLIVQPLLENAIYHAMELMDGDGVICINGYLQDGDVYIEVADNGLGIPPELLPELLAGNVPQGLRRHGKKASGIGLRNVHQRIQLYFGEAYGLQIESELDVGTTIRVHLPAYRGEQDEQKRE